MPLRDPRRLVSERLGEPYALDDLGRVGPAGERDADPAHSRTSARSERKLIALMARLEAEGLIETVRRGAALVGGELNHTAAAFAAFLDRPVEHRPADPAAALARGDAHALDLTAPHAAPGEPGNEAELQDADHLPVAIDNREELVRVAVDSGKRLRVARVQRRSDALAPASDRVVGEHADDRRQIVRCGAAKC